MTDAFDAMVEFIKAAVDVTPPPAKDELYSSFIQRAGPEHRVHALGARLCQCRVCGAYSLLGNLKLFIRPSGIACPHCGAGDEIDLVAEGRA